MEGLITKELHNNATSLRGTKQSLRDSYTSLFD